MLIPLLVALAACIAGWLIEDHPRLAAWTIWRRLRGRKRWIAALALLAFVLVGADKGGAPTSARIAQFVTALRSGLLLDDSGQIGSAATMAAVQAFESETQAIIDAAFNVVAAAQADFDAAAFTLTNRNLTVAYIAMDLPRAEPNTHTNSNIAVTIERVQQVGSSNLVAWVWFSEEPAVAPTLAFDASIASNTWVRLTSITNSYPDETEINGVPCVSYTFSIPVEMRGTVLRPEYEVGFGGSDPVDYLIIPRDGVLIQTNGVSRYPFTGWDYSYPDPFGTNLSVRYSGGVAVEANFYGTNYTGSTL
jgi:hypothetical protein